MRKCYISGEARRIKYTVRSNSLHNPKRAVQSIPLRYMLIACFYWAMYWKRINMIPMIIMKLRSSCVSTFVSRLCQLFTNSASPSSPPKKVNFKRLFSSQIRSIRQIHKVANGIICILPIHTEWFRNRNQTLKPVQPNFILIKTSDNNI